MVFPARTRFLGSFFALSAVDVSRPIRDVSGEMSAPYGSSSKPANASGKFVGVSRAERPSIQHSNYSRREVPARDRANEFCGTVRGNKHIPSPRTID